MISKALLIGMVGSVVVAFVAATATRAEAAGTCTFPATTQAFAPWGDSNAYFLAPGGDFESGLTNWITSGGAGLAAGNESYHVNGAGTNSLALPTPSASVTTPTMCVTVNAPSFRMFVRNSGNLGKIDGQLAVYLNFQGADGKPQRVKIAGLTVQNTNWIPSPKISFIQYISTPLKSGYANVSFTIQPNDNHGNWQLDDVEIDPYSNK